MRRKKRKKTNQDKQIQPSVVARPFVDVPYLCDIPPLGFWALFLLFAGYFLVVKIASVDLWWHMACGRYFIENGAYPPTGTFTFSPVNPTTPNARTWLGDLLFYLIFAYGGQEIGLQVFRMVAVIVPVFVFIHVCGYRYNTWTLLGSLVIVWGTMQQHLLRNSMLAMIFLPMMVLIWHRVDRTRKAGLLFLTTLVLFVWTPMHGYALVGLGVSILIFIGELIDQALGRIRRSKAILIVFSLILLVCWSVVSAHWSLNPVGIIRNLFDPLDNYLTLDGNRKPHLSETGHPHGFKSSASDAKGRLGKADIPEPFLGNATGHQPAAIRPSEEPLHWMWNFLSPATSYASIDQTQGPSDGESFRSVFVRIKDRVKWLFRPFLRGGDAEYIEEYRSPFDAWGMLPAKVLFIFVFFYAIYLVFASRLDRQGLKFSYLLPSAATLFLGLGHLRTMAFPFLVALPMMASHLTDFLPTMTNRFTEKSRFIANCLPWSGALIYFLALSTFFPGSLAHPLFLPGNTGFALQAATFLTDHRLAIFAILTLLIVVQLCSAIWSESRENPVFFRMLVVIGAGVTAVLLVTMIRPDNFLDDPIGFLIVFSPVAIVATGLWKLSPTCRQNWYFRFNPLIVWLLPLLFCLQFALATHAGYLQTGYLDISGLSLRQPGFGKNYLFSDEMPRHVLETYKNEDMLNSYNLGGYLMWVWNSEKKVFIDSRSANYQSDFYEDYRRNYGYSSIEDMHLNKALMSISLDEAWYDEYLSQNWTPIALDSSMVLLQRPIGEGYAPSYGILPSFIGQMQRIRSLPRIERRRFGLFINSILRYMLLFGRLADAAHWLDDMQPVVRELETEEQRFIAEKTKFIQLLTTHFGKVNDPLLADACRQLEKGYSQTRLNMVIGDVHKLKGNRKEAALAYLAAARLQPKNVGLQRKVADRMFELKLINQAISQYEAVVRLRPASPEAYTKLGYLYSVKKDYKRAAAFLKPLLSYAPNMPETYINLASVLSAGGQTEEAIRICERGLEKLPGNITLELKLNQLKGKQGD